jgi:hypothetical protein
MRPPQIADKAETLEKSRLIPRPRCHYCGESRVADRVDSQSNTYPHFDGTNPRRKSHELSPSTRRFPARPDGSGHRGAKMSGAGRPAGSRGAAVPALSRSSSSYCSWPHPSVIEVLALSGSLLYSLHWTLFFQFSHPGLYTSFCIVSTPRLSFESPVIPQLPRRP